MLEKTIDELKQKHLKEVQRLEADKTTLENHYVKIIRELQSEKEQTKDRYQNFLKREKDLNTRLLGGGGPQQSFVTGGGGTASNYTSNRSVSKERNPRVAKAEQSMLKEENDFYKFECDELKEKVETLTQHKEELIDTLADRDMKIEHLEAKVKNREYDIDSLTSEVKKLR